MKRLSIFALFGCFFSIPMLPMMRKVSYPIARAVRTCANQAPQSPVKSVKERIESIDQQLARLVKNSEEQNERLWKITLIGTYTAFCTWMLIFKPTKQCKCR